METNTHSIIWRSLGILGATGKFWRFFKSAPKSCVKVWPTDFQNFVFFTPGQGEVGDFKGRWKKPCALDWGSLRPLGDMLRVWWGFSLHSPQTANRAEKPCFFQPLGASALKWSTEVERHLLYDLGAPGEFRGPTGALALFHICPKKFCEKCTHWF